MKTYLAIGALAVMAASAAEKVPVATLIEMAHKEPNTPAFRSALIDTLGLPNIQKGTAVAGQGSDFLWAIESSSKPNLFIDDLVAPAMTQIQGSKIWFTAGKMRTGISHSFHYVVDSKKFGGNENVPAYGPDSYEKPGVPKGTISEKMVHTSKIYDGMQSNYWIYVPAQYDPAKPAALMVWQDGQGSVDRNGATRLQIVTDNLIAQKKIPVMIHVLIQPGTIDKIAGNKTSEFVQNFSKSTGRTLQDSMRSTEYDTVTDRYARFLRDELLPEVYAKYNIRKDAYSRGIAGNSSGAIAAFNAAWFQPDQFSRVISRIGTYTSIQWQPGVLDGGNVYPNKVRKEPSRNLRVWLQDGSEDLENAHGSWPLQNLQMANSLKMMDYDFHLSFGNGSHNGAHGNSELPEELTWLWRDYAPSKTEQKFQMEPFEKAKPLFRVKVYNRDIETSDAR
jgi:enterochelin esterase-like enzyme